MRAAYLAVVGVGVALIPATVAVGTLLPSWLVVVLNLVAGVFVVAGLIGFGWTFRPRTTEAADPVALVESAPVGSTAFRVRGGRNIVMRRNTIRGFDRAIDAEDVENLKADDNDVR